MTSYGLDGAGSRAVISLKERVRALKVRQRDHIRSLREKVEMKMRPPTTGIFLRIPSLYWFNIYAAWVLILGMLFYLMPTFFLKEPYALQNQDVNVPFSYFLSLSVTFALFVICCSIGITLNVAFLFTAARDWSLTQNRLFLFILRARSPSSYLVIFLGYMTLLQLLSVIIAYIKSDSSIYFYDGAHKRIWTDGIQHGFCKMVGGGGSGE
ncbi:hypothetical protein TrRE_jg9659, partial [Triparma retinervis]